MSPRQQQNQQGKRSRGRNGRKGGGSPLSRVYESNGPEVKVRGNAAHIAEKYVAMARDAAMSGDTVRSENLLQHAEHYSRIVAAAQPQQSENSVAQNQHEQANKPKNGADAKHSDAGQSHSGPGGNNIPSTDDNSQETTSDVPDPLVKPVSGNPAPTAADSVVAEETLSNTA